MPEHRTGGAAGTQSLHRFRYQQELSIHTTLGSIGNTAARCCCRGCLLALLWMPQSSWSLGTLAGTRIANQATVHYTIALGPESSAISNTVVILVDEIIAPLLTWQDAAPIAVDAPSSNAALRFLLTNAGNGSEAFGLTRSNGSTPLPPGSYTPLNGSIGAIFIESGSLPGFQASGPAADPLYVAGRNDPTLAPNASMTLYLLSDTPSVANNLQGDVLLRAAALTVGAAGAMPGTALAGLGQGGGFAVVGSARAHASATGSYITSGIRMALDKTVLKVLDPRGTTLVMPGAELTYQVVATLTGVGTASHWMLTDPLPSSTRYVAGSMVIDGAAQTDAADTDKAQFIAATQSVSVSLGHVAAPATVVLVFRALIQ